MTQGDKWWASMIKTYGSKEAVLQHMREYGKQGGTISTGGGFAVSGKASAGGKKGGRLSRKGLKYLGEENGYLIYENKTTGETEKVFVV